MAAQARSENETNQLDALLWEMAWWQTIEQPGVNGQDGGVDNSADKAVDFVYQYGLY
jgi:hypothetical protein